MKNLVLLSFVFSFSTFNLANEDEHSDMHDFMAHLLTPASEACQLGSSDNDSFGR